MWGVEMTHRQHIHSERGTGCKDERVTLKDEGGETRFRMDGGWRKRGSGTMSWLKRDGGWRNNTMS